MKKLLTAAGAMAALLIPVGALTAVGMSNSGASTHPVSVAAQFAFAGPTIDLRTTCPSTSLTELVVTGTTYLNQDMVQISCTTTGTVGHTVPATGTDRVLFTPTALRLTLSTPPTGALEPYTSTAATGFSYKVIITATNTCTVAFPSAIPLVSTNRTHSRLKTATGVSMSTTTVTPSTNTDCQNLNTIFHTPNVTFSVTLTFATPL